MRSSININSFRKEIEDKMTASHTTLKSEIEESLANSGGGWTKLNYFNDYYFTLPDNANEILVQYFQSSRYYGFQIIPRAVLEKLKNDSINNNTDDYIIISFGTSRTENVVEYIYYNRSFSRFKVGDYSSITIYYR